MISSGPKDVLLVGFGAIGAIYAFIMESSGAARCTVVARSNYQVAKDEGTDIQSQRYGIHKAWRPYRFFPSVEEAADRAYTHVVVATKIIAELQTNAGLLQPLLSIPYTQRYPQPTYVLMQNGMNIEVDLWDAISALDQGTPQILGASMLISARQLTKNVVEHGDFDQVSLGIYRTEANVMVNSAEEEEILNDFGKILSAGGTQVTVVPEIQRVKFAKNAWNCVLVGPACALPRLSITGFFRKPVDLARSRADLSKATNGATCEPTPSQKAVASLPASSPMVAEYTLPWLYDVMDEVIQLGHRLYPPCSKTQKPGIDPDLPMFIMQCMATLATQPKCSMRPSMLVDVEMGRPTEVEVVVGEVVRMAKSVGFGIPRLETLYALMLVVQENTLNVHMNGSVVS
ncbi:hypothetical protein EIP91_003700 [Steccherinum ochraceum]|uniref:Ketopantoate reductase C-terminal domain-containing protein n=1 Tax=Steccherinum ochraceum TaxID=92696 RepID=A0A4R0S057_9APHY|nr:hypothetical protein EIP91_003700 [Steccherinum ochraceum]